MLASRKSLAVCFQRFLLIMRCVLQVTDSKAARCFYAAHAYLATGKQLEAHALFGRAAQHAKQAVGQHQVRRKA